MRPTWTGFGPPCPRAQGSDGVVDRDTVHRRVGGVVADEPSPASHASTVAPGHVYKITVPHRPDRFEAATLTSTAGADQVRHLVGLNPDARRSWLDRQPSSTVMNASLWLHLFVHIDVRIREQPHRRSDWVTLRLWLLDQAALAGVFNPHDYPLCQDLVRQDLD